MIPNISSGYSKLYSDPANPNNGGSFNIGDDANIAVTSGLNLDLTLNPDFSNVEADRQVMNLTRLVINFPEQRQFYIENSDLFSGFGSNINNPFLPPHGSFVGTGNQIIFPFFLGKSVSPKSTTTDLSVPNRIIYGTKPSGKVNDNLGIGLLNSQTADEYKGILGSNFRFHRFKIRFLVVLMLQVFL